MPNCCAASGWTSPFPEIREHSSSKRTGLPAQWSPRPSRTRFWIPIVAKLGWLVITRDAQIQGNLAEIEAVRDNGCKMLNLSSSDASTKWGQLELFMTRWREIELLPDADGPFIIQATRTGKLAQMDLDSAIAGLKRRGTR